MGERNLAELEADARAAIAASASAQALVEVRARFLGRKGSVSTLLRGLGELPPDERAKAGQEVNAAKERIEAWVVERRTALERASQDTAIAGRALDISLPGTGLPAGQLHPLTRIEREMREFFRGLGFSVEEGPQVETEFHNFDALRLFSDHPARDMQDTFFVEGGQVLRTHTSSVQIRAMSGLTPPFRFIAPGVAFRPERTFKHSPMFHQIEGFIVDETTSFADLKGVLYAFARAMAGGETELRFRASYFPFTEPSAEMDFTYLDQWIEWGGCGMIHPGVLENCGIDSKRYQGFAFGLSIDRIGMLRHDLPTIHQLFDGDMRTLEQL